MLIQFSVRYRLNPTSDLRGLPTSLTTCVVFINQARSIHNSREKTAIHFLYCSTTHVLHNLMKSQLYTYLHSKGRLVLPASVAEFFDG